MTIATITPAQAKSWLLSGEAVLIDVREPDEFKAEHIAYAASMPLGSVGDLFAEMPIPSDKKVLFQCQRGGRGAKACAAVQSTGVPNELHNIEGGIDGWKAAGFPVVTSSAADGLSIFRQVQIVVGALVVLGVLAGFNGLTFGFVAAGLFGAALFLAGITGWCGLAMLLTKMPWNR
jgi:rhodanese-related sulfurtransferase